MKYYVRESRHPYLTPDFTAPGYDYVAVIDDPPAGNPASVRILSTTIYGSPDSGIQQVTASLSLIRGQGYRLIPWGDVPPAWQALFAPFKNPENTKEMDQK